MKLFLSVFAFVLLTFVLIAEKPPQKEECGGPFKKFKHRFHRRQKVEFSVN